MLKHLPSQSALAFSPTGHAETLLARRITPESVIMHPDGADVSAVYVYKPGLSPDGDGRCAIAFVGRRVKWDYYFPDRGRLGRAVARLFAPLLRGARR